MVIATLSVGMSAYVVSTCNGVLPCDNRLAFSVIWTLVPIASTLGSLVLPPPLRRYLAGALAAAWLLLAYVVWSGFTDFLLRQPLVWGAVGALSFFAVLWLRDERTN